MSLVTRDTRLIFAETEEYPLFLEDFRARTKAVIGATIDSEALVDFGYFPVDEVLKPTEGDVITEGKPVFDEQTGKWQRTWDVRDHTPEEAAAVLQQAKDTVLYDIAQFRLAQFRIGFPHLFNGGADTYHVQVRDSDRVNILARYTKAKEALEANDTEKRFEFRVYENVSVFMTAQEMVDMGDASDAQVEAGYRKIWALKIQTENATTLAEIPTLPESLFTL